MWALSSGNQKFNKNLKKILTLPMYVLNFYKKKRKWMPLFMLFGKRTQNIGSFQTCTVFMLMKYLEESPFQEKVEAYQKKKLTFI